MGTGLTDHLHFGSPILIQGGRVGQNLSWFFSLYKIRDVFALKLAHAIPKTLRSRVVYKFLCAGCNACYVGETNQHLAARIRQGLSTDIFQHLESSETCRASCSEACFSILDTFQLKIQEALHIGWEQPSLDKQIYYVNLSLAM